MVKKSRSKASGESSVVAEKQRLVTPSTDEAHLPSTSAMLESSPSPKSQIGFRPTQALGEIDDITANLQVLTAFASKLGALVFWRRLQLNDGQEVIALCFPLEAWAISPNGTLSVKKKESRNE
jgi:hypothetical protein